MSNRSKFDFAWWVVGGVLVYLLVVLAIIISQPKADDTEGKVKTVYDITGRPVNQGQDSKGIHRITGQVELVLGVAVVNLNTNISNGRQDVSFISENTYSGRVWVSDTSNTNTYAIYPQSGTQFIILSSSATDTNTVNYWIEGE
jgi:hypothetical protein